MTAHRISPKGARRHSIGRSVVGHPTMATPKNIIRVDDWVAETSESITARLEGAKTSQAQIRRTLGILAVVSMMMLIASYNAYLSYDYNWIVESRSRQRKSRRALLKRDLAGHNRAKTRNRKSGAGGHRSGTQGLGGITNCADPLIGIRVSIDDAPVLGSACCVCLRYGLCSSAAENHTINSLLHDTDTPQLPRENRDPSVLQCNQKPTKYVFWWGALAHLSQIISNSLCFTFQSFDNRDLSNANAATRFKRGSTRLGCDLSVVSSSCFRNRFFHGVLS